MKSATRTALAAFSVAFSLLVIGNPIAVAEEFFTGAPGSDYDTGGNWNNGAVPNAQDATIGDDVENTNASATLATTPPPNNDFRIGKNGATGVLNHSAGTLTTNNWAFIGVDSTGTSAASGTYNLTGSASYAQTTAIEARFEIGGRGDNTNPAQGLVHVDTTGSITTNNASVGTTGNGRFELVNGTHDATGFLNIGSGFDGLDGGTGVYEQTGGELNVNGGIAPFGAAGWFSIANGANSTGDYNMSGGTLNQTIDFLTIGDNGVGTMTIDGTTGTPDVNIGANGIIVGRNGTSVGRLNVISDGAAIDTTNLIVGLNDALAAGGSGTVSFTSASSVSPINASADVNLGNADLVVDLETSPPPKGDVLLVAVGGTTNGEFNGLPQGAFVPDSGGRRITYRAGGGSSIALVPEPSTLALVLFGSLAVWARRRRG